jgi:hypothetical protein
MVDSVVGTDDVAIALRELAEQYARRLGSSARVDQVYGQGIRVRLRPARPGAVEVGWNEVGGELAVAVGEHGWKRVDRGPQGIDRIEAICDAVAGGRGQQVTAPGRALVTLAPEGGPAIRMIFRTGWAGFVPLPGWTAWGHRTRYAPYA